MRIRRRVRRPNAGTVIIPPQQLLLLFIGDEFGFLDPSFGGGGIKAQPLAGSVFQRPGSGGVSADDFGPGNGDFGLGIGQGVEPFQAGFAVLLYQVVGDFLVQFVAAFAGGQFFGISQGTGGVVARPGNGDAGQSGGAVAGVGEGVNPADGTRQVVISPELADFDE